MAKLKAVRVIQTCYGTYALHYINPDGRRRRLSVGKDFQLAQRQAIKFSDWLIEGKDPECELEHAEQSEKAKKSLFMSSFRFSWIGTALAVVASLFLTLTARTEEAENIRFFGAAYEDYMKRTKMFVPFLF